MTRWKDTPTQRIRVNGVDFAYRDLGTDTGVPVVFLHHLTKFENRAEDLSDVEN